MAARWRNVLRPIEPGPSLPRPEQAAGQLVYAVGDVHGRYELLRALLSAVVEDCAGRASGRRPVLILMGDYVDRGPDSARVLAALVWLRRHSPFEVHCLKGNHEAAFLAFLDDPVAAAGWIGFGADETLLSYGVAPPDPVAGSKDLVRARDDLLEMMPVAHLTLLRGLEQMIGVGDYVFAHAGIRPGVALADQQERDLLWIREPFLGDEGLHERTVVHGHSWRSAEPFVGVGRIGIDTGAYETDVLTAIRIEDGAIAFLQADDRS